ncbi:glycosyltransferase family 9 protein [Euzebyella saccharophila]|uniref:Glycosyltransferase family 9 protein n=1 Tax=Euzebyella saccharophila TaxID=679664 RepID=A0ABV8JS26_9FLAO|nr:glycosyltransferase family 9 protein [Euzebyella saccharophila]
MAKNKRTHILVIRLSAMGDVAMTVPVLNAFVQKYPDVKITVLTRAFFTPLFSQLQNVSVYEADVKGRHKGVFGLWKLFQELKKQQIDVVADLHNVLRSNILKKYFRFGRIPFAQIDKGRKDKKALTKKKAFRQLKTTHQRYADVFGQLGYPIELREAMPLKKEKMPSVDLSIEGADILIGIAPFAAFKGKMYPFHLMEKVVKQLSESGRYKILLFGGGEDEKQKLQSLADLFPNCYNIVGKQTFVEELSLISNLKLMLSMDSGNGHLAAMYGIPVVTLWGVTHPFAGFAPFGQPADYAITSDRSQFPMIPTSIYGNKMPEGYEKAMETIRPEIVVAKINAILQKTN